MKDFLLASVGLGALAIAPAAAAQEAPQSAAQARDNTSAADGNAAGIGDIIVTASRRTENVQRSALSIQAISSDALTRANVTRPEDLNAVATGVQVGTAGAYPQVFIRGVGSYNVQASGDGAVAFSLDGVFISRAWATRGMFFDLERIEVLKGPQGTLYGRNASGGAVNLISAKPKLGERGGFAEFQVGNYRDVEVTTAVNLPMGDNLALRAAGHIVHRDGYLSDGYSDDITQSARLQLLWEPDSDLSVLLNANYQHSGGMGDGAVISPRVRGTKFVGSTDPDVTAIFTSDPLTGPINTYPKTDGFMDISVYAVGAEINWNLGFATLTAIPAYREGTFEGLQYLAGFGARNNERNRQASFEMRLGNDGEMLKWVLGGYYFNEHGTNIDGKPALIAEQGVQSQIQQDQDIRTESAAAFGQATVAVSDRFRLTGGLRYTYERKKFSELLINYSPPSGPGTCRNGVFDPTTPYPPVLLCRLDLNNNNARTYNSVTWKAGAEYDLASQSMAYANVSTGFKSGGFYSAPQPNDYRPEKLTAFEVGVKNRLADNRLQINIEGFFWRYEDHQETAIGPTSLPGFFTLRTTNAGRAKSYGADLDVVFMPTPDDNLSLNVQYNKTNYDSFVYRFPSGTFGPAATGCAVTPFAPPADQIVDCSGRSLVRAPLWSGSAGYSHDLVFENGSDLRASFNLKFASSSYLSPDFLERARQKAYATGDFDLTYTTAGGRLSITAFVHNIWDEEVKTQATRSPFISPSPINPLADPDGLILATVRPPRTFGGRVRLNF